MKLKKVAALCNKSKVFRLYDKIGESGEMRQWLGDGFAIYPLDGLPILDEESLCAVFDISGKKRENLLIRHERLPDALDVDDVNPGDRLIRDGDLTVIYGGSGLKPLKTRNGITFIQSKYEAHKRYRENLAAKGAPLKIGNDYELAEYLERKILVEHRSPAAALADIRLDGREFKTTICTSTFYSYIEKGVFLTLTNANLPEKPKKKRKYRRVKEAKRASRGESIENRPPEVDTRTTFGHWEGDTVYSKKEKREVLLVLTERETRQEIMEKMPDRTKESVVRALDRIERRYGALFPKIFKTITFDNGGEFADVEGIERSVIRKGQKRTKAYFCHPYSSYERGSNECQNKMIRRDHLFPKGTDFGKVTAAAVKAAEAWVNNYPREILGWRTSEMLFRERVAALAECPS